MGDQLGLVSRVIPLGSYRLLRFFRQAHVQAVSGRYVPENSRIGMIMGTDEFHMEGW